VKPGILDYVRARSRAEALEALAAGGPDVRVLAGGQSLVPMLNLRVARPTLVVDIGALAELGRLGVVGGELWIGAVVRHQQLVRSPVVRQHAPLLAQAVSHVGHTTIRNRGTLGGTLAHADPCGEALTACLALGAVVVVESAKGGTREIAARDLVAGPYETVLRPEELLTWVRIPLPVPARTAFYEFARRHGDFALAGAAVALPEAGASGTARAAVMGPGLPPMVVDAEARGDADDLAAAFSAGSPRPLTRLQRAALLRAVRRASPPHEGPR
jgi:CO/xanthine dehydrogenase FAD-binding subunit